jgi:hypothetical protein
MAFLTVFSTIVDFPASNAFGEFGTVGLGHFTGVAGPVSFFQVENWEKR